jgi:Na+-transporting NADH:ubiquinone oxidoreductase subunit C
MPPKPWYTIRFAAAVSVVCSILVATAAVVLQDRQDENKALDQRRKVLDVAGLIAPGERLTRDDINQRFETNVEAMVIELATGAPTPNIDPQVFDQREATQGPSTSEPAPRNNAGIARLPHHAVVYLIMDGDEVSAVILPVRGKGLWSTLYGFIALSRDLRYVKGVTFYEHGETPGLGAEIDNPRWQALWEGRQVFDEAWQPQIAVIKGHAGPVDEAPFEIDGIAGSTITGRGVTNLLHFWLGADGFGPFLKRYRDEMGIT